MKKLYFLYFSIIVFQSSIEAEEILELKPLSTSIKKEIETQENSVLNAEILEFQKSQNLKNPQSESDFFQRGLSFYHLKDYTSALNDFTETIKLNTQFGEAYFYRGLCKKALKDLQGASSDFKIALRLNPKTADYYLKNALSKEQIGNFASSIEEYDKALELNASLSEAYMGRGNAKTQLGNYSSAIEDFTQVIKLNNQNALAYKKRGYAYYKLNRFFDSMRDHEKAKELYKAEDDFINYQSSIRSINLLREIMLKNQAEESALLEQF